MLSKAWLYSGVSQKQDNISFHPKDANIWLWSSACQGHVGGSLDFAWQSALRQQSWKEKVDSSGKTKIHIFSHVQKEKHRGDLSTHPHSIEHAPILQLRGLVACYATVAFLSTLISSNAPLRSFVSGKLCCICSKSICPEPVLVHVCVQLTLITVILLTDSRIWRQCGHKHWSATGWPFQQTIPPPRIVS